MVVNRKKGQRLWGEADLRVAVRKVRTRSGPTTTPVTEADAPNMVWAMGFGVRLHRRWAHVQDRLHGRRTHPGIAAENRRTLHHRIGVHYVAPGQPWPDGYIESFNSRCRDECLNLHEFDASRVRLPDRSHGCVH